MIKIDKNKKGRSKPLKINATQGKEIQEPPPSIVMNEQCRDAVLVSAEAQNGVNKKENIQLLIDEKPETNDAILKKRGRKPKGGKLIIKQIEPLSKSSTSTNVILHLKCSLNDLTNYNIEKKKLLMDPLDYDPNIPPEIMTYNETNSFCTYKNASLRDLNINNDTQPIQYAYTTTNKNPSFEKKLLTNLVCEECKTKLNLNTVFENTQKPDEKKDVPTDQPEIELPEKDEADENDNTNMKDINVKLKNLKMNLYKNLLHEKKSACFWCTYEFDNSPCYIPKCEVDEKIYGYGSFCRPECAVAYLMKENIDDSQKFERYHLLNQIYSKVYHFKKSIKPAPNPYFLLDKFYGNLSIQEYRKLLKTEHMLLVIEKPMTRILPELHEDNESMMLNIYGGTKPALMNNNNTNGVYKVKKQSEKQQGPTKTSIIRDKFGLS